MKRSKQLIEKQSACVAASTVLCVAVTDSAGGVLQALRYDPWGNIMDNSDGHLLTRSEQPELLLERGYTGHEHLPQFGLINMNARLYEPLTARFLSPDPEVQAPDFSQNLNRYTYCLNNPIRYIDPTGMTVVCDTIGMTEQQKASWLEFKRFVYENELMSEIYNRLDGDISIFTFKFGTTTDDAITEFNKSTNTIIYNMNKTFNFTPLIEEFIHVFQFNYYIDVVYDSNIEFEAKIIASRIASKSALPPYYCYYSSYGNLNKIFFNIASEYDCHISDSLYRMAGMEFVEASRLFNNPNIEYFRYVEVPSRLFQKYNDDFNYFY